MRILAVTNMYPTPEDPAAGTFIEQQIKGLRQIGLEVDVMFVDRARRGMAVYLGLARQVQAKIDHFQPHIVHAMYGGFMAEAVMRAARTKPTVVSFCGSDLLGERLSRPLRRSIAACGVLASRRAARRAWGIVVKSKNLQDALPDGVDHSKVRTIPNGIDLERFKPLNPIKCRKRLGWSADSFHVLFSNQFGDPCKRFHLAQSAVEALNSAGIQTSLQVLRGVAHEEVSVWLNASDVVLVTSQHEGSPNIIKEALCCNVPVVSVDVGDVRERIQGIEGCHLALPEANDLAAKLCLVRAGLPRVAGRVRMQELSLERVAMRLNKFYKEILASNGKTE